jgi:DNA primase small subunit
LENAEAWRSVKGIGPETWEKILDYCAKGEFVKIDTVVTADIHRLVRLPNTLHGKTGFKKVEFSISQIDDFDPFKEAIAFKKGTIKVLVHNSPQFRVGEETFGPYKNVKVELPAAAAILLICKGKAEVSP